MTKPFLNQFLQTFRQRLAAGYMEPALDSLRNYLFASVPELRSEVLVRSFSLD